MGPAVGLATQRVDERSIATHDEKETPPAYMIEKSEQQDIDRHGKRLMREALERLGWVLTEIDEDYGVDYDVQVFANGSPNGVWFKIQLKSSASSDRSARAGSANL
jgi:hypothetical protein